MKLTLKKIPQEKETLNTLKSIDRTLKRIEQILSKSGDITIPTIPPLENGKYIQTAMSSAIRDISL